MNRLTKSDEKRATEALAKCAAATKHIDNVKELNDRAFDILYSELGDKPELLKRACEGYNSAKSVYRLGAATDDTRGNDFALLDAPALAKRASDKAKKSFITKSASAYGIPKAQFMTERVVDDCSPSSMNKVASGSSCEKTETPMLKGASLLAEVTEFVEDTENSLRKMANARDEVSAHTDRVEEEFISEMRNMTPSMRKEAAEMLYALHGEPGDLLIKLYNAAEPMNKIASYNKNKFKGSVAMPKESLYKAASAVLTGHMMLKMANAMQDAFICGSVESIKDIMDARESMQKSAAMIPTPTYGADLAGKILIGQEVVENLPGILSEKKKDDLMKDVWNVKLNNALRRHGIKRAFMNTVTDSTVSRYPLHQVTGAFNDSLAELPLAARDLPPSAFTALVKSRTIARLGRGGAASGSDVDQVLNIEKSYGESLKERKSKVESR